MEDEGLLLSNQLLAPKAVEAWRDMGVDVVRIHARWFEVAPAQSAQKMPSGFDPNDDDDPQYDWAKLDAAVAIVHNAGLKPMLTITGPGPLWSSASPAKHEPRYKPKAAAFASFAKAVAKRYRTTVDRYLLW